MSPPEFESAPMIRGIEQFQQRIVTAMTKGITEEWSSAELYARFYSHVSTCEAEYVRSADGRAINFRPEKDAIRAVDELREAFRKSSLPLWGEYRFLLRSDGKFKDEWSYIECNACGNLVFDERAELQRREERRIRLNDGRPRDANRIL